MVWLPHIISFSFGGFRYAQFYFKSRQPGLLDLVRAPVLWLLSTLPAEASLEERISALLLTWTWMLLGGAAINW